MDYALATYFRHRHFSHSNPDHYKAIAFQLEPPRRTARNASCGMSTFPSLFIRFLPADCFSNNFIFLVTSPPYSFAKTSFLKAGIVSRAIILLPDAACMGCALPYVRQEGPYSGGAPADRFAPWYVGDNGSGTLGWGTVGGPYWGWTGCIPEECSDAAFSFDITSELQPCISKSPPEVISAFPSNPEKRRKCALIAACGTSQNNPNSLWEVHDEMHLLCNTFGEVATDSCVSTNVNLENPLCNAGQVVGQTWDAAVVAALAVVDGIIGTVGEMVYGKPPIKVVGVNQQIQIKVHPIINISMVALMF